MGSPNNADVVTGAARIRHKEISTPEWCSIIGTALSRIRPCLKYVAGFETLAKLMNGKPIASHGRFVTPTNAMPSLAGTGLNQKTRFVVVDIWDSAKGANAKQTHEINQSILLLTDFGNFAILSLSCFRQKDHYAICASSLIATSSKNGQRCALSEETQEIRDLIDSKSISPYSMLDRLYLLFYSNVADGEKRLDSKRQARDMLKQMCDRISLAH